MINKNQTKEQLGPDFAEKQPTPYLYDSPVNVSHSGKHQSGVGTSDRNNNGIDDSEEQEQKWERKIHGFSAPVFPKQFGIFLPNILRIFAKNLERAQLAPKLIQ